MAHDLASFAKQRQAVFARTVIGAARGTADNSGMPRKRRTPEYAMQHLRAWRDSLGLSRPAVVNKIGTLSERITPIDQATLAKWESGETAVKVEDIELLAKVYGVSPDRLFFPPGDTRTPELLKRAHEIITSRDPAAVERWLASGSDIRPIAEKPD